MLPVVFLTRGQNTLRKWASLPLALPAKLSTHSAFVVLEGNSMSKALSSADLFMSVLKFFSPLHYHIFAFNTSQNSRLFCVKSKDKYCRGTNPSMFYLHLLYSIALDFPWLYLLVLFSLFSNSSTAEKNNSTLFGL